MIQGGNYSAIHQSPRFDVIYDAASGSGAGEDYRAQALPLLKQVGWAWAALAPAALLPALQEEPRGQYVAINGAASMWARRFTIGQKYDHSHTFVLK